jgi:hypothetical protein
MIPATMLWIGIWIQGLPPRSPGTAAFKSKYQTTLSYCSVLQFGGLNLVLLIAIPFALRRDFH